MKKIGLTLDDDTFNIISKISVNNEMTPTTICSLILKLRCQWYKNKGLPQFKTVVYENIKSQETTQSILSDKHNLAADVSQNCEQLTEEELNEIFGPDREEPLF